MADIEGNPLSPPTQRGLLNFSMQAHPGNLWFAAKLELKDEEAQIWKSQVLISPPASLHVYLRPFEKSETDETKAYFPHNEIEPPSVFTKNPDVPHNLYFMKTKVFSSAPRTDKVEQYLSWLDRVEKHKGAFWKSIGIFDLIQLSKQGPRYQKHMLLAALHFWNSSTNSLHLKCGMLTPTLLYIEAITGLKPTGEAFDPSVHESSVTFMFDKNRATGAHYITDHHKSNDTEHLAFLTYWLPMYVFCTRSKKVAKGYRVLAHLLHEGKKVCLSKLILGSLYECLNDGIGDMRDQVNGIIIPGPIWLFQLWLLATFRKQLEDSIFLPEDFQEAHDQRSTEGIGLALLQHREKDPDHYLFLKIFTIFMNCDVFTPSLAPFLTRTCGPTWFVKEFPTIESEHQDEINAIWKAYLTHTLLSSRTGPNTTSDSFGAFSYQPNLVARQFVLIQPYPSPFFKTRSDIKRPKSEQE